MGTEVQRERAIRLFQFLRELTLLRTKIVRSCDDYENILWFNDVPKSELVYNVFSEPADERSEIFLEITRPSVPLPPRLPEILVPWINQKSLNDPTVERPPINQEILVRQLLSEDDVSDAQITAPQNLTTNSSASVDADSTEDDSQTEDVEQPKLDLGVLPKPQKKKGFRRKRYKNDNQKLSDHPEIQEAWDEYVDQAWSCWAREVKPVAPVLKLYDEIFEVYQKLQKLAETYELLLCVGLLTWKTPHQQVVRRHLLAAPASIHFDASLSHLSIRAASEESRFRLEQDMLEVTERPATAEREAIETSQGKMAENFWDEDSCKKLLEGYAHSLSSTGAFSDQLTIPKGAGEEPLVHMAPAVILRPRTDFNFVRVFDEIVDQLDGGFDIPSGLQRIVDILDDDIKGSTNATSKHQTEDEEIYFPLPANKDQREIAEKLQSRQGILVQGPPGTGKSHTIVNIVCHLLALGKKVLVTSHTPRALNVLREKFPKEMQALCVSVVGDDSAESRQTLEESISSITAKNNTWNAASNTAHVTNLHLELDELRRGEQWNINSLRAIKEKDTFKHTNVFGDYAGTSQTIAQRLLNETEKFSWFVDHPEREAQVPLTNAEASTLLHLLRNFDVDKEQKLQKHTLKTDDLMTSDDFAKVVERLNNAQEKTLQLQSLKQHECYVASSKLDRDYREKLLTSIEEIISLYHRIRKRPEDFAQRAANEILGDHDRKWRTLLELTQKTLRAVKENHREISQYSVSGIENLDRHTLRAAAIALEEHLKANGRIGFWLFKDKAVKNADHILKNVRVDGRSCENRDALQSFIEYLDLEISLARLKHEWSGISDGIPNSSAAAVSCFEDYCEVLDNSLKLHELMKSTLELLSERPSIIAPEWQNIEAIKIFRDVIASGASEEDLNAAAEQLKAFENMARNKSTEPNAHPVLAVIATAISTRDIEQYQMSYQANLKLLADKRELEKRDELLRSVEISCPMFASAIKAEFKNEIWEKRCEEFEQAFFWGQATEWLKELGDPSYSKRLTADLNSAQVNIRATLQDLAIAKAWDHMFLRMSETQRQHLVAWSMAVKRIGKGKGKYAEKHRRDARIHMEKCRPAIPAWIMPIYKVVETVKPGSDVFDVIIVDEASQSGPEALFLTYLGKQLIIVGDDKQISPDIVGLDRAQVDILREQYLEGVPFSDAFGVEHSFFDQANIRYRSKVSLKEHFRCMPEIIQFSNNLCYQHSPLIPLKQYGAGRLTPVIKTIHVPTGYSDDKAKKQVNIPEAEAVLNEIKRICSDPACAGKTLGVISLLNSSGQAEYIERELKQFGKYIAKEDFEKRNLTVGNPYQFQGDERDIMILSMVSSPQENGRIYPMTADKDERRFNVAVSRAKEQLILVHSVTLNDLNPKCIRHKLLTYCLNPHVEMTEIADLNILDLKRMLIDGYALQTTPPKPFDSWFEVDVFIRIADRGYRVIPQVNMNGYKIDLIVEGLAGRMAVECDGDFWHGPERYDLDMARQRDLERCGMKFWRVRGSAFYRGPEESLEELWRTLEYNKIYPSAKAADEGVVV